MTAFLFVEMKSPNTKSPEALNKIFFAQSLRQSANDFFVVLGLKSAIIFRAKAGRDFTQSSQK